MAAHFTSRGNVVTPTAATCVHRSKGQSLLRVTTETLVYFHCVRVQGRWLQNLKIKSVHQCFLLIFNCSQQHSLTCVEASPPPRCIQILMNAPHPSTHPPILHIPLWATHQLPFVTMETAFDLPSSGGPLLSPPLLSQPRSHHADASPANPPPPTLNMPLTLVQSSPATLCRCSHTLPPLLFFLPLSP